MAVLTAGVAAVGLSACGSLVAMEQEAEDGSRISARWSS